MKRLTANSRALPAIVRLFLSRRPSHIAGRVIAVIVDAVHGVSRRRSRPDVSDECSEIVQPFFGYANAPPAVSPEVFDRRIVTASLHARPNAVFGSAEPALNRRASVGELGFRRPLSLETPATLRVTGAEFVNRHRRGSPAIAFANPLRPRRSLGPMEDRQTTKSLPCKVQSLHRKYSIRSDASLQGKAA